MNEHEKFFEDLKRDVDTDHRRIDGADSPPAHTWQTIRAQAKPTSKEERDDMSATKLTTEASRTPGVYLRVPPKKSGRGFRHSLSMAASFLIVASVALAGWFATMQLHSPDGSDGAFGLLGQSNEEATCNVEPMTVDDVMEIVKNPYSVMDIDPQKMVVGVPDGVFMELAEPVDSKINMRLLAEDAAAPNEDAFNEATTVMNGFLDCAQHGTVAQIFRFLLPMEVQRIVLANFPVFRDEATVRAGVEEIVQSPASQLVANRATALTNPELYYQANPDREGAKLFGVQDARMYESSQMILIGTRVTNSDGEVLFENIASGVAEPIGTLKTTDRLRVLMVQSAYDDEWYVLATIPE